MPRGGRRVGAGRKPKESAVVLGMDGARREVSPAAGQPVSDASDPLMTPPPGLLPAQAAFWQLHAPHAIEQRTLIPATVAGFRELCEQYAMKQAIADKINQLGPTKKRAESHLKAYVKLAQRFDATLARFKLTSFGKAADSAGARKPAANPWAQVAGR